MNIKMLLLYFVIPSIVIVGMPVILLVFIPSAIKHLNSRNANPVDVAYKIYFSDPATGRKMLLDLQKQGISDATLTLAKLKIFEVIKARAGDNYPNFGEPSQEVSNFNATEKDAVFDIYQTGISYASPEVKRQIAADALETSKHLGPEYESKLAAFEE